MPVTGAIQACSERLGAYLAAARHYGLPAADLADAAPATGLQLALGDALFGSDFQPILGHGASQVAAHMAYPRQRQGARQPAGVPGRHPELYVWHLAALHATDYFLLAPEHTRLVIRLPLSQGRALSHLSDWLHAAQALDLPWQRIVWFLGEVGDLHTRRAVSALGMLREHGAQLAVDQLQMWTWQERVPGWVPDWVAIDARHYALEAALCMVNRQVSDSGASTWCYAIHNGTLDEWARGAGCSWRQGNHFAFPSRFVASTPLPMVPLGGGNSVLGGEQ